ncbi:MAG: proline--tRNA ligase [Candidatus Dasytiphilus stammeri]
MRTTQYPLFTLKQVSSETELISYQLMLRAGLIRKLASGLYTWLPMGIRVLRKLENIIREEMNKMGALEIVMPILQPAELWQNSGRWYEYGPELLRFLNRSGRNFVLGPTHEEVITDLMRNLFNSYKQLPIIFYQIQTKFRDEARPRFGTIRSREFLMKDAYSFHDNSNSLQETYMKMYNAYSRIFHKLGLNYRIVQADTGCMGGKFSHEFQVLTPSGENKIVYSTMSDYAANIDLAEAFPYPNQCLGATQPMLKIDSNNDKDMTNLMEKYQIPIEKTIKTLVVKAKKKSGHKLVALLIRGDHELNMVKSETINIVAKPLTYANEEDIRSMTGGAGSNYLGPINLPIPIIADRSVMVLNDFCAGANIDGQYYIGINWIRDLPLPQVADLRNVRSGDPSPDGQGLLKIHSSIEVGHIFQLGTKYSEKMKVKVHDNYGRHPLYMGCYGIGISRLIATIIEQNYDDRGIIWPKFIAPFKVAILPVNLYKSPKVKAIAENIYSVLCIHKIDSIIDDRNESHLGIMFAEMELIGVPHMIIISERNLKNDEIEYQARSKKEKYMIKTEDIIDFLLKKITY